MSAERNPTWRYIYQHIGITLMRLSTLFSAGVIVAILLYLLDNALPALSWEFVFDSPRNMMTAGGAALRCREVGRRVRQDRRQPQSDSPVFDRVRRIGSFC